MQRCECFLLNPRRKSRKYALLRIALYSTFLTALKLSEAFWLPDSWCFVCFGLT